MGTDKEQENQSGTFISLVAQGDRCAVRLRAIRCPRAGLMNTRLSSKNKTSQLSKNAQRASSHLNAQTHSGRFTQLDSNKLRGGYYTSDELAEWLSAWAIRRSDDMILEPSCGDGAFLKAASNRLGNLGAKGPDRADRLRGIEIFSTEADKARKRLEEDLGIRSSDVVEISDFFAWWKRPGRPQFDAVVGNPPFIRYQTFPEPHRSRAMNIMQEQGLSPNRLTNIWVPFVVAAASTLKAGGRMALVLPAELLQVSYAAQLRSFLTDRFGRVDLIACNEMLFKGAEQEVLLLLADEARSAPASDAPCKVNLIESNSVAELLTCKPEKLLKQASPKTIVHDSEKWLKYFLNQDEISFMRSLRASEATVELGSYASVNVGVVTGKNQFFVLRSSEVEELGLQGYTIPLIGRSAHLNGAKIDKKAWQRLAENDQRVHLLHLAPINGSKPKGALASYLKFGESLEVHKGYKCSIRKPWYAVPSVYVPDAFVFRQIYDFPRIVLNEAEATATDTIHRMRCHNGNPHSIIANSYTFLTAASAEIEGRSYGGGVLELEPTEAEKLLMPANFGDAMTIEESDELIRAGKLNEVLEENSRRILVEKMGLSVAECNMLRGIWEKMRNRRLSRSKSAAKFKK
ncbi:Eco57I restriction-modification methylase domain-containing protein [Roseovarius indicus]|uniref:Eco57I restriction-modification methylase domain-containing protein n=1 Tax=Roseovarius indicus TaxID=540747 RepID=UPI0035134729